LTLVAIHQPNFLPWLGWFDKLAQADVFVLLDTVAAQQTGSNYTNRVQILSQGAPLRVTVPIARGSEERSRIDRLRIVGAERWRRKLRATLEQAYRKTNFFVEGMAIIDGMLAAPTDMLCELNLTGIAAISAALGLRSNNMVRASSLAVSGAGTELLVALVRAVGGDAYLSGHGSGGYQSDETFTAAGIAVYYQRYAFPPYRQLGAREFVSGLSAIDAVMNCGPEAASLVGGSVVVMANG
jgi:hypothetical protein